MINFQSVKNIAMPEGEVVAIACGSKIIWQKEMLPSEYQKVDYIESTGTQYIDTGVTINTATDTVELVFQNVDERLYKWLFGEHDNAARFGLGSGDGVNKRNVAYGATTYKVTDAQQYNTKHTFVANGNGVFIDDAKIAGFASFNSNSTLYLFNLNLNSGDYRAKAKIWDYKHKRNGGLVRNFIPCYRKSDGEVGMYDTVTKSFCANAGTGEFVCEKPKYKREIAYLESTGTQYIDTGIKLSSNYSVEVDYQITATTQTRCGIFGGLNSGATARYGSLLSPSNKYLEHGYGVSNEYYQTGLPDTDRHLLKQEKNLIYVDGVLIHTFGSASFSSAVNAYLGNFNYSNYTPAKAKYYSSKWWNGNTLVRDFIPVLDWYDVPCMYDKVSGELFYNKGTGEFKYL